MKTLFIWTVNIVSIPIVLVLVILVLILDEVVKTVKKLRRIDR